MISSLPPPPAHAAHAQVVSPLTNPNLSATLRLEYDALVGDMRRAEELCAEFQRQLAGKANEVNEFKELFAKTQSDLFQLQDSIIELREERHCLANEAMRAAALTRKLAQVTAERDGLIAELEVAKQPAPAPLAITEAAVQAEEESGVKAVVSDMWRTLERLQTILDSDEVRGEKSWSPGENERHRNAPRLEQTLNPSPSPGKSART